MRSRLRLLMAGVVILSAALPFAVLAVGSVAGEWRWPALVPSAIEGDAWTATLAGGTRLGPALLYSLALGLATGVLGTCVALPVGRAIAELHGWRRHLGAGMVFLPVAAPPIALGTGLQLTSLSVGLGGTFQGVLLAHLIPTTGYLSLFFVGILSVWDRRAEDEARTLGANPRQVLTRVTLPMLRPSIAAAAALGFLISWGQVPLTLLVGRGRVPTLPLEVFGYVQSGQERFAAAGALLLALPPLLALGAARLAARDVDVVPV
ncbi:MAG: ABC transporter permease subunit [Gemmatimonadetes bacterium]|nr:ABC transporter permease subunit [Gemmatimonadota bacterium]